jgi:hypothetical protein
VTPEFQKFAQIVGAALLSAIILDLKNWARAPKGEDGRYAPWDWQAAIRAYTDGLLTGISATGIVAASG